MKLHFESSDGRTREVSLEGAYCTIGRGQDNDVVLADRTVSRYHCRFEVNNDGFLLVDDRGSRYGTFVNGTKLKTPMVLSATDRISIGGWVCSVTDDDGQYARLTVDLGMEETKRMSVPVADSATRKTRTMKATKTKERLLTPRIIALSLIGIAGLLLLIWIILDG